jgi:glycosyltransferase involved in cell wall biosynthesis
VHSPEDVLPAARASERLQWLQDASRPLTLVYFGRFVPYKGLDRAVEALRLARAQGEDVRLLLVGEGECLGALTQQVAAAGLEEVVTFLPAVRYGEPLFEHLTRAHVSIATPLVEDTPRAAFDALARGLPIVAFDISYFRDLQRDSGAVALAHWPDARSMAEQLVALSRDRERVAAMAARGLSFALGNTQAAWLERRAQWVQQLAMAAQPEAAT